jgi:hypothetical protein
MWKETRRSISRALWSILSVITFSYFKNGKRKTEGSVPQELKESKSRPKTQKDWTPETKTPIEGRRDIYNYGYTRNGSVDLGRFSSG